MKYISSEFRDSPPYKVLVNGNELNEINGCVSKLENNVNTFTLIWNTSITNCYHMFFDLQVIKSIDFTKFDTSKVTNMMGMFWNCRSLTSLDLSNFNVTLVTAFNQMFYHCVRLKFLNLISFIEKSSRSWDYMFDEVPLSVYCIDKSKSPNIGKLMGSKNNCSYFCYEKSYNLSSYYRKKCVIFECINNSITYLYEYQNECYKSCPKRTIISSNYYNLCEELICDKFYNYEQKDCLEELPIGYFLNDSHLKTIDKCYPDCEPCNNDSSCLICSIYKYRNIGNCVLECIKGYYQIYNTNSINSSTIYCYKEPEGYYLYKDFYRPCYSTC